MFLTSWQILVSGGFISSLFLASPVQVLYAGASLLASGELQSDIAASLVRVIVGFILAAAIGIPVGIAMGTVKTFRLLLDGIVHVIRQIPGIAWLPLAILFFGLGNNAAFFLITYVAIWPFVVNLEDGLQNVDQSLIRAARSLGARRVQLFFRVYLPAAVQYIYSAAWIAVGLALRALIVAELAAAVTGPGAGIGYMIIYYASFLRTDIVILGMALFAVFGFAGLQLLVLMKRFLKWMPSVETGA